MERDSLLFGLLKDDANFQLDPWELPPYFLLRDKSKSKQNCHRTHSGYWKEKAEEVTAIRSAGESSFSSSSATPSYVGVRKTLEFYLKDGTRGGEDTKTDWIIHEYHNLRKDDDGEALFLEEDVVLRNKVFKKGETDQDSSLWRQVESCVRAYEQARIKVPPVRQHISKAYLSLLRVVVSTEISDSTQPVKTSEGLNEDLGAHCHPDDDDVRESDDYVWKNFFTAGKSDDDAWKHITDGKSDNDVKHLFTDGKSDDDDDVWKHFTKICTSDPYVVYATCHHCDKVLKAHPKKHGTTQLKRHRSSAKCRSSCGNPSTDKDREMLHRLCTVRADLYKQQKIDGTNECQEVNANLTQLNPWVLGHNPYVTTSLNRETNEGCWEEIDEEFTGIRTAQQQIPGFWMDLGKGITTDIQNDYQMQMQKPLYMGLRRTLEFHHIQNGEKIKTGWIMLEYQQLRDNKSPAMFLQGDMVIHKILPYDKGAVTAIFNDFGRRLNGDNDSEERNNGKGVNTEITTSTEYINGGGDRKRKRSAASKRTSEVWMYFTEIRTADDDVVYAVCHHCDRGYGSARSTIGTSHLWRHTKSCTNKLRRTENANDITTEWNAEIWPRFLVLKNYGETEHQASGTC